jgi:hypothetical protein
MTAILSNCCKYLQYTVNFSYQNLPTGNRSQFTCNYASSS